MVEIKHQFTEEVLHTLAADSLAGADLAGMTLAVAELPGADLQGANLEGANLAVANLADANLGGCNLRYADFTGAVLTGAKLNGADLTGANLTGADLGHAILDAADLGGATVTGANLTGADLHGAQLHGADLTNAGLSYAILTGAVFDDRTQFPALFFDPESEGAVRGRVRVIPDRPAPGVSAGASAGPESAAGMRAALVLLDFQTEWLGDDGKFRHLLPDAGQQGGAVDRAATALMAARRRGLPVAHCGLRFEPGYPELGTALHGLRASIRRDKAWVGAGREFAPGFAPAGGEFVVAGRVGVSAFAGSNLDAFLRNQGVRRVYLAGIGLHVSVLATLCQAHDLGYDVVVLEDACPAFTPEQRRAVLDDILPHFGVRQTVAAFEAGDEPA